MSDPVVVSVSVPVAATAAFNTFVADLATWWPAEYTWSGEVLDTIAIEPRVGGRCFERGPHGFECDWGRVTEIDPPASITFLWQIGPTRVPQPDPARASRVHVRFEDDGAGSTRVRLTHDEFDNHGDGAAAYRDAMASDMGWSWILQRYVDGCS